MRVVLIATYEMGRQPFGLASPAAWLRRAGFEVECADVSRRPLAAAALAGTGLIAFHLPMHTATRLALRLLPQIAAAAPGAHLAAYGLYAPMNRAALLGAGVDSILGGEFEADLVTLAQSLAGAVGAGSLEGATGSAAAGLPRLRFLTPDRAGLPPLERYAQLQLPDGAARVAGYTEASRGCKHLCRHCPIVPVYQGKFRVVAVETVLADIRQQVEAGAAHISFGDPDFLNGPSHARRIVTALHEEFPDLSYDVTIKVEHLLRHRTLLPVLRDTGCALITTAVESFDDAVLARLEKGHTQNDFLQVLRLTREHSLGLNPTFVAFTPWTTVGAYANMCEQIERLDLVEQVAPVQYGIRLLIPAGSRLLELAEAEIGLGAFDPNTLSYPWASPDAAADALCAAVQVEVAGLSKRRASRRDIFSVVAGLAGCGPAHRAPQGAPPRATVPYLNEPWFC